jgi:hypothetical protein
LTPPALRSHFSAVTVWGGAFKNLFADCMIALVSSLSKEMANAFDSCENKVGQIIINPKSNMAVLILIS